MNSLVSTAAAAGAAGFLITGLSRKNVPGNGVLFRHHIPVI